MCEDLLRHLLRRRHLVQKIPRLGEKYLKKRNETNILPESLRLYERCQVTGCVTERLRIPDHADEA